MMGRERECVCVDRSFILADYYGRRMRIYTYICILSKEAMDFSNMFARSIILLAASR